MLLLIVPGRATFRNLSRYSDSAEKTFSRWFRRKVDRAGLNVAAIRAVVSTDHDSVLAFDPSFVPKSGKWTAGLGRFWNGGAGRAEPGLDECLGVGGRDRQHRLYPQCGADPARTGGGGHGCYRPPTPPRPEPHPPRTRTRTRVRHPRPRGVEAGRVDASLAHRQRGIPHHDRVTLRYLTADGYFGKVKFVDGVKALNLELISQWWRDADVR
jgi:hypothetical protein